MTTTADREAETPLEADGLDGAPTSRTRRLVVSALTGWVATIAVAAAFIALWEFAATKGWVDANFTGQPTLVWEALKEFYESGRLFDQTIATLQATLIAFVIGVVGGTACGLLLGVYPGVDRVLGPLLVPLNSVPRIALAPLFILWFGLSMTAKVVLAVSIVFFIVLFNARAAVKSVEPDLMTMARVTGFSRLKIVQKVILPSAVPSLFAGVRLAITYALLGVIASEMIAARDGLGQDIVYYSGRLQVNGVWATLLVLAVIATLINVLFEQLERWLLRWQE